MLQMAAVETQAILDKADDATGKNPQKIHVPDRGMVWLRKLTAEATMGLARTKLSSDRLLRVQQAAKQITTPVDSDRPMVTNHCHIGVLYPNGQWYLGMVLRMYHKSGKKKALQLDPVEFETMKPNFCVDCQFFRAVENSTNLFKCHGVDTESVEAAEILAIVDMQFQKETGYWKLSPESLEVLEDAKERASS